MSPLCPPYVTLTHGPLTYVPLMSLLCATYLCPPYDLLVAPSWPLVALITPLGRHMAPLWASHVPLVACITSYGPSWPFYSPLVAPHGPLYGPLHGPL